MVSGVALLQGENMSKKAKVAKPARPDRSKLSLPTKSRFEPRRSKLSVLQVKSATQQGGNLLGTMFSAQWLYNQHHTTEYCGKQPYSQQQE